MYPCMLYDKLGTSLVLELLRKFSDLISPHFDVALIETQEISKAVVSFSEPGNLAIGSILLHMYILSLRLVLHHLSKQFLTHMQ